MLVGFSFFGLDEGVIFGNAMVFSSFDRVEISNSIVDDIYITTDLTTINDTTKPTQWGYFDVLNCDFESSLEGGSVAFNGSLITKIIIQRRLASDLLWENLKTIDYISGTSVLYSLIDTFIQNDITYQYALVPISNDILGNQVTSPDPNVTAVFDGNYLTDSSNNYQLLYDSKFDSFTNNVNTSIIEPLDSQYPIVVTSDLNYRSSRLSATLVSDVSFNSDKVSINQEYKLRQRILSFINNRQPKLIRNMFGDNVLIMVTDKPEITYLDGNIGIASISFSFVEIGDTKVSTLAINGLVI